MDTLTLTPIAVIRTDFPTKFGLPRQSGLVPALTGTIVFQGEYRHPDTLKGIEEFSHLWLIWGFSENKRDKWHATVRPPRLNRLAGAEVRKGVFATRAPFRPNPIGLSCVELLGVEETEHDGMVLHVSGVDMMNNTPIYDIKPYLPLADAFPDASSGYTAQTGGYALDVCDPKDLLSNLPEEKQVALLEVLKQDPRPSYQQDPARVYGFLFGDYEIKFHVDEKVYLDEIIQMV